MIINYFKGYFKRKNENFTEFQEIAKENISNYKKIFSFKDIKYLFFGILIGIALSIIDVKYKYIYTCTFFILITFFLYTINSKYKGTEKRNIIAIQILKIIVGVIVYNFLFIVFTIFSFLF